MENEEYVHELNSVIGEDVFSILGEYLTMTVNTMCSYNLELAVGEVSVRFQSI